MTYPGYKPENQPQLDSRENLFYFLQTVSKQAGIDRDKFREETSIAIETNETGDIRHGAAS